MGAQSEPVPAYGRAPGESTDNEHSFRSKHSHSVPDANWIRDEIPIADVALTLGLKGDGKVFDCFRETHPSGKPRRSLSVHGKTNTVRCFACDKRQLSTIDLVMDVQRLEIGDAIKWLAERFPGVPMAKVQPSGKIKPSYYKTEMTLQNLINSPGWVSYGKSAKIVLAAIFSRVPLSGSEQFSIRCTYSNIQEWTGLARATVAKALSELRKAKAIQTHLVGTGKQTGDSG